MSNNDANAIAELHQIFDAQRAAFSHNPEPEMPRRIELLQRIPEMLASRHAQVVDALQSDYKNHPALTATLFDFLNILERNQHALDNIEQWMQREERPLAQALYGSSVAYIRHQPKGVIGNLSAWNFPFDISFGPMIDMLAAGNRVIIKPSEQVPACGEVMREMIGDTFAADEVAVVTGGLDLARHFSTLHWDHLVYTGNTRVGREVALKAAQNLVPVTLELGGKNPVILTEDAVTPNNVERILATKITKNGQICINVDHVYVPRSKRDLFLDLLRKQIAAWFDDFTLSDEVCNILNQRQWSRLQNLVEEARESNPTSLVELGSPASTENGCRMPFTVVCDPAPEIGVSTTEMFGPILPIHTFDTLDEVINGIHRRERPLGIYMFSNNREDIEYVRSRTSSGGFTVNCVALHGAQANLGFGGVGHSGTGRHHGIEGFREFSNPRAYLELADDARIEPLLTPHREQTVEFVRHLMST
ncbi:aldehyde dehydrogenase family protein [Parahaliea mediterranea]|uniref:aldehyde dehydrogenase family protein n=1 Tax=Parahaliea mediterranea TaxID=651086 RepID=UPI000E2F8DBB|nr:aldehyde dehydrogenase family protein [Parahaliea mediterranea]